MPLTASDTHPEIERIQIQLIRQLPPWRKLELVAQLNRTVRTLAISGLEKRHPDLGPEKIRRLLADLLLGEELALKVYGPIDLEE